MNFCKRVEVTVSVIVLVLSTAPVTSQAKSFPDVNSSYPYSNAIDYVTDEGIANGVDDGARFAPDQSLSRAELTKMLISAKVPSSSIDTCIQTYHSRDYSHVVYSDVPTTEWFSPHVCVANNLGIVNGYPDQTYKPHRKINFAEAAKIITMTYGIDSGIQAGDNWYSLGIHALDRANAIPTSISGPFDELTRGELAEILYRLEQNLTSKSSLTYDDLFDDFSSPEASETAFNDILIAERDYILNNLEQIRDDVAASSVSRSQTNMIIDVLVPETMIPGGLSLNLVGDIQTRGDVKDAQNPKIAMNGTVDFDFESGALATPDADESVTAEGSVTGELRFIGEDAYGFLESKQFTSNDDEWTAIAADFDELVGNWYKLPTDTLAENGLSMTANASPEQIISDLYDALSDLEIWELKQALPSSDGQLHYEVALNNTSIEQNLNEVMTILVKASNQAISDEELEQMRADITDFATSFTMTGVLTVPADNYDYFTFDGQIAEAGESTQVMPITITNLETQKGLILSNPETSEVLTFAANNDDQDVWQMSLTGTTQSSEETQEPFVETFMTGSKSDDHLDITISDRGTSIMTLTLDKDGDTWAGTADFAGMAVLNIEELIIDTQKLFRLKGQLSVLGERLVSIDITSIAESSSLPVDLIAPKEFIDLNEDEI